ncbi:MAG: hypothetical protein H0U03_13105 [Actinobacteria bacterium]|nr:hypothetical protein [Actinomycetota bacterium]
MHRYALRRTSGAAADEVASETFTIAWRRLDDIPAEELPGLLGVGRRTPANPERSERRQD